VRLKRTAQEKAHAQCDKGHGGSSNQPREKCHSRQDNAHNSSGRLADQHAEQARSHKGAEMKPPADEPAPPTGVDFPKHENRCAVEQDILPEWRAEVGHA